MKWTTTTHGGVADAGTDEPAAGSRLRDDILAAVALLPAAPAADGRTAGAAPPQVRTIATATA